MSAAPQGRFRTSVGAVISIDCGRAGFGNRATKANGTVHARYQLSQKRIAWKFKYPVAGKRSSLVTLRVGELRV